MFLNITLLVLTLIAVAFVIVDKAEWLIYRYEPPMIVAGSVWLVHSTFILVTEGDTLGIGQTFLTLLGLVGIFMALLCFDWPVILASWQKRQRRKLSK